MKRMLLKIYEQVPLKQCPMVFHLLGTLFISVKKIIEPKYIFIFYNVNGLIKV